MDPMANMTIEQVAQAEAHSKRTYSKQSTTEIKQGSGGSLGPAPMTAGAQTKQGSAAGSRAGESRKSDGNGGGSQRSGAGSNEAAF